MWGSGTPPHAGGEFRGRIAEKKKMGIIGNQKTTLWEVTVDAQLAPAGTSGFVVAIEAVGGTAAPELDLHDGTGVGGTKIASKHFSVANDVTVFPVGFMPEFTNGLYANVVAGTTPIFKVYTA